MVAEVTALLARYETAVLQADGAALERLLWQSTKAAHFGAEARGQARPIRRTVLATRLTTFGRNCATSAIRFNCDGMPGEQLESQTWVRLAQGWRIVASHAGPPGAGEAGGGPQAGDPQGYSPRSSRAIRMRSQATAKVAVRSVIVASARVPDLAEARRP